MSYLCQTRSSFCLFFVYPTDHIRKSKPGAYHVTRENDPFFVSLILTRSWYTFLDWSHCQIRCFVYRILCPKDENHPISLCYDHSKSKSRKTSILPPPGACTVSRVPWWPRHCSSKWHDLIHWFEKTDYLAQHFFNRSLSSNQLTVLPDNIFASLTSLQNLWVPKFCAAKPKLPKFKENPTRFCEKSGPEFSWSCTKLKSLAFFREDLTFSPSQTRSGPGVLENHVRYSMSFWPVFLWKPLLLIFFLSSWYQDNRRRQCEFFSRAWVLG